MGDDLTIVCFLWQGDRWSKADMLLGVKYVQRLFNAVERNLSMPFRFVCFSNIKYDYSEGIELRPLLPASWKGCLPKVYMFCPYADLIGQVLALDIDIIITGCLDDICSYRGDFIVRSKFAPGQEYKADGDIIGFQANHENAKRFWYPLVEDPMRYEAQTGGRERWYYRSMFPDMRDIPRWQDKFPNQIYSYKRHCRATGKLPNNARIISCHGRPRPHELKEQWAVENWR
jgi:hypothetical protein